MGRVGPACGLSAARSLQERSIAELRRQPPAAVILPTFNPRLSVELNFRGKNPLLEQYLRENFLLTDSTVAGWLLYVPIGRPVTRLD